MRTEKTLSLSSWSAPPWKYCVMHSSPQYWSTTSIKVERVCEGMSLPERVLDATITHFCDSSNNMIAKIIAVSVSTTMVSTYDLISLDISRKQLNDAICSAVKICALSSVRCGVTVGTHTHITSNLSVSRSFDQTIRIAIQLPRRTGCVVSLSLSSLLTNLGPYH